MTAVGEHWLLYLCGDRSYASEYVIERVNHEFFMLAFMIEVAIVVVLLPCTRLQCYLRSAIKKVLGAEHPGPTVLQVGILPRLPSP